MTVFRGRVDGEEGPFVLSDAEFKRRYPHLHAAWEWEGCPRYAGWDSVRENRIIDFEQYGIKRRPTRFPPQS